MNDFIKKKDVDKLIPEGVVVIGAKERGPIWFVYAGMGGQWIGMGQKLMAIPLFDKSLRKSSKVLEKEFDLNVYKMLKDANKENDCFKNNALNCMVAIVAILIALTDFLRKLGIEPDGFIGHSLGEIVCGYATGRYDREQAMKLTYYRGKAAMDIEGAMAAVDLTWAEAKERCPEGVFPACHNSERSLTISGDSQKVEEFVAQLKSEGIRAKKIDSAGIPFHSPFILKVRVEMLTLTRPIVPNPMERPQNWLSTSVPDEFSEKNRPRLADADYSVNNFCNPVLFYETTKQIPDGSIVIEISPHRILQRYLKENVPSGCTVIGLINKDDERGELVSLLTALGEIHAAGVNLDLQKLYPSAKLPKHVPLKTPMLAPYWSWDHSKKLPVLDGGRVGLQPHHTSHNIVIKDKKEKYTFWRDHVVKGLNYFPFTGHIWLAWKTICIQRELDIDRIAVVIENLVVERPLDLSNKTAIQVDVVLPNGSSKFEVRYEGALYAHGSIRVVPNEGQDHPFYYNNLLAVSNLREYGGELDSKEIYQLLNKKGYEFGKTFQVMHQASNDGSHGILLWDNNWVTFMDAFLHHPQLVALLGNSFQLPISLRDLRIDPVKHRESIVFKEFLQKDGENTIKTFIPMVPFKNELGPDGSIVGGAAGGINFWDSKTKSTVREQHKTANMEKLHFLPNFNESTLDVVPMVKENLLKFRKALFSELYKGLKQWEVKGLLKHVFPSINASELEELTDEKPGNVSATFECSSKEGSDPIIYSALLLALKDLFNNGDIKSSDSAKLRADINNMMAEAKEILLKINIFGKFARDFAVENFGRDLCKFAFVKPESAAAFQKAKDSVNPFMEIEWTWLGKCDDKTNEALKGINLKEIDIMKYLPKSDEDRFDVLQLDNDSLSKKRDPISFLKKCAEFLLEGGCIVVCESIKEHGVFSLLNKLISGKKETTQISQSSFDASELEQLFEEANFRIIFAQSDPSVPLGTYVIKKKLSTPLAMQFRLVNVDDDGFLWVETLKEVLTDLDSETSIVLTSSKYDSGIHGLYKCLRKEYPELSLYLIADGSLQNHDHEFASISDVESIREIIEKNGGTREYVFRDGKWGTIRASYVSKEEQHVFEKGVEHAYMTQLDRGDPHSFGWTKSMNSQFSVDNEQEQVLVYVCYAGICSRGAANAQGTMALDRATVERLTRANVSPFDISADVLDERHRTAGTEFVGYLADGTRVGGIAADASGAIRTTIVCRRDQLFLVPERWTMEEAVTIPLAYTGVFDFLVQQCRIHKGDKIVVIGNTLGVGQAAISVALAHQCKVFAIVEDKEFLDFVKSRFLVEINNGLLQLLNFRSAEQSLLQVDRETDWQVNAVVIASSQKLSEATTERIRNHGGKISDIGRMLSSSEPLFPDEEKMKTAWKMMTDAIEQPENAIVEPLVNQKVFPVSETAKAIELASSEGKVFIKVREELSRQGLATIEPPLTVRAALRTLISSYAVCLITGSCRGFGLELAQWLVKRGARKLVLTSRRGEEAVERGYPRRIVEFLRKKGVQVFVSKLNVADKDETVQLIRLCKEMGPLEGVFHLAVAFEDKLFKDQTPKNFWDTAQAKYYGTVNLDETTRSECPELRDFVVFSSIASGRGNKGQTAYGCSNSATERIVEKRRADGHPGIAIQWGAIGDVGLIVDKLHGDNNTEVGGTLPQRIFSCLESLDLMLTWNHPIVACYVPVDKNKEEGSSSIGVVERIRAYLDTKNENTALSSLGFESSHFEELKNLLQSGYGIILGVDVLRKYTPNMIEELINANSQPVANGTA